MIIKFQQLLPAYFSQQHQPSSGIWLTDLELPQGELVEIVAPSGSGKTSLIHFMYGMRTDYNGSISYGKNELRSMTPERMAELRQTHVSIVFQDMRLFNTQSVRVNIELKRQLAPHHNSNVINEMASRLGIYDKLDNLCGNCSYGEQQRIAVIRALMQPFSVLLLDEPFSHLDNKNAAAALDLILEEAAARKATVILADLERTSRYPHTRLFYL
ncbi:MAG: ATP-binding cassette domain-containing protein [Chitinophagaceae bacterium]|nr:MAG: ATP-binding cassette domain-containing protein [Chitinophagaceae bacterium]